MKNVVIMCRVSSEEQAKGYSLSVQFEQLTNYCKRNEANVIKYYREDHSAKDFNRPQFQNFLKYVKNNKGKIDTLLITSWDRFSRNLTDALVMLRRLAKVGVQVQAIEQPIDMSIPENKAMLAIFLAIPEIDNDRRSIKIKGGMRGALKAGRWCRVAPYGYSNVRDENNKPIIVHNDKAKNVQYVFNQVLKGVSQTEIRLSLYKKGTPIPKSTMSQMLGNLVYIGKIIVPELENEPKQIIEGLHEAIVSEQVFQKVQQLLISNKENKNSPSAHTRKEELPLRGVLSCSNCSKKMTGSKSKSRNGEYHFYYHCNHCRKERHRAQKVNLAIEGIINDLSFTKQAKTIYKSMVKDLLQGNHINQAINKKKTTKGLANIQIRINKLQDLYVDGGIDKDTYDQTMLRYNIDKTEKTALLENFNTDNTEYEDWIKNGIDILVNFKKHYQHSDVAQKQQLLGSIFPEKIDFDGSQCRTTRINEVLAHILLIDSKVKSKKKRQISSKLKLSRLVAPPGLEPGSIV
jgi:site-specific DNA recombinase